MAANFVVAGQNIKAFPDGFVNNVGPTSGIYYAVPRCNELSGNPPYTTNRNYNETRIFVPGVAEVGTKRIYPFGIKGIYADLIFAGTKAQCESLRESFMTACEVLARYTISMPDGASLNGCKFGGAKKTGQTQLNGIICMKCAFEWVQLGTSN